jgi:hypothetical protein
MTNLPPLLPSRKTPSNDNRPRRAWQRFRGWPTWVQVVLALFMVGLLASPFTHTGSTKQQTLAPSLPPVEESSEPFVEPTPEYTPELPPPAPIVEPTTPKPAPKPAAPKPVIKKPDQQLPPQLYGRLPRPERVGLRLRRRHR